MQGVFLGLTTLDIMHFISTDLGPNDKIASDETRMYTGGPAANSAITFALLGHKAHLITDFGNSALSSIIERELSQYGVTAETPQAVAGQHPSVASVFVDVRTGNRAVVGERPLNDVQFFPFAAPAYHVDVMLSDTYHLSMALPYLRWAYENRIPTVLDGGSWKEGLETVLPFIRYAICSERFVVPGCSNHDESSRELKRLGVSVVCFTRGERPMLLYAEEDTGEELPVVQTAPVIDTLGAGDIFHGAFCSSLAEGLPLRRCLQVSAEIAADSVRHRGPRAWGESLM